MEGDLNTGGKYDQPRRSYSKRLEAGGWVWVRLVLAYITGYTVLGLGLDHFASRPFNYSQDEVYSDMLREAISKIKRVQEKLDPSRSGTGKMASTFHLIATHPRTGLTCCRLSQDQAALQCGFLTPDDLEALVTGASNLFEQVGHIYNTCFTLPVIRYKYLSFFKAKH